MTSKIKVDNINKVSDDSNIIKKCGSTTTVGSGSGQTVVLDGATITLGRCGGAVNLASGATQSGFGRTGTVNWCTTAKTGPLTVASGNGYFLNTSGGAITVTLPASPSAGDIVAFKDYANTWDDACKAVTVARNGSKINGVCGCVDLNTQSQSVTLIYVDGTKGWQDIHDSTSNVTGTVPYNVQYLVVAGGGGGAGATYGGGGGGAGGYRTVCSKNFNVDGAATIPIVVGGGAPGRHGPPGPDTTTVRGTPSVFSTITSTGGGGASFVGSDILQGPGGSGGGSAGGDPAGGSGGSGDPTAVFTGNTPPVSPPQGNPGGTGGLSSANVRSGGGGGASAAGQNAAPLPANSGGNGGDGSPNAIFGSLPQAPTYGTSGPNPGRYFAGGGSGRGGFPPSPGTNGSGGDGGGAGPVGSAGTTNTGGGGAGNINNSGGNGGSGIVVIRHGTSCASGSVSGGNVVLTCGSDTVRIFTADGTFVA